MDKMNHGNNPEDTEAADGWVKPEIVSFAPVEAAEGIMYNPSDGLANLTP
jgi:hypothetical protein